MYDCLRANKSTSAWGLEARVPFLDKEFVNVAMDIDPDWKMVSIKLSTNSNDLGSFDEVTQFTSFGLLVSSLIG